jgi:hypothetical protein
MFDRTQFLTVSLVLVLGCLASTHSPAQVVSEQQAPAPGDSLDAAVEKYSIDNIGDIAFDGATPENYFLTRHQGRLVGLKFLSTSMDTSVDYGPDSDLGGPAYWDEYGLGTYYTARGGPRSDPQVWHTNFTNGEHRQITDGACITGIGGVSRTWRCVYNEPIASSVNRIAFIQEIFDVKVSPDAQKNKHIVIGANGTLRSVRYEDALPDHMDWSPDGNWLVYTVDGSLAILVLTDTNAVAVQHCPLWDDVATQIQHPEWVWDGGLWIVYATDSNIWRVPVQKPRGREICPTLRLNQKEQLTNSEYEDSDPQWMNVGNLIAFSSRRPLNDTDTSTMQRIWALQPGQNSPRPVVVMPFTIKDPDWQRVRETPQDQKMKDAIRDARGQGGN